MSDKGDMQGLLDQIKYDFIDELPSKIDDIEQLTLNSSETDSFQDLYRNVHSLKGNGGTLGLPIITSICHQYESFLAKYADKTPDDQFIKLSLVYIDLLKDAHTELKSSENHDFSKIEEKLAEILKEDVTQKISVLVSVSSPLEFSILEQVLPDNQYSVTEAQNGIEALQYLTINKYDLLITSLETDLLNGVALITAVKNNSGLNKDIKSILLTSKHIEPEHQQIPSIIITKDTELHSNLNNYLDTL